MTAVSAYAAMSYAVYTFDYIFQGMCDGIQPIISYCRGAGDSAQERRAVTSAGWILEEKGSVSTLLDEVIHTRNLSDRKDIMTEKSDVLVALPGGVGTLDEVFHVIAAASIGYHHKKVIFYNEYGFYNELLKALKTLEEKGFARQPFSTYYEIANTPDELKEKIN